MKKEIKRGWIKPKKDKCCTLQLLTTHWLMPCSSQNSNWSLPANSPQFTHWTWHSAVWNIPLASLGQLFLIVLPPGFLCTCSLAEHGTLISPWLRAHSAQQQLKHQCVNNIILILNPKHSTVPATKKIIPDETRTQSSYYWNSHDKWSDTINSKNDLQPCTVFTYKKVDAAATIHH